MRIAMGLLRNKFGVYYVRKKVPKRLERAVAQVLRNGKERQSFLKQSLRTKKLDEAKRWAPAALLELNGIISGAEARLADKPARTTLSQSEITRMSGYFFADLLRGDERMRRDGFDPVATREALIEHGIAPEDVSSVMMADPPNVRPRYGLSDTELQKHTAATEELLPRAERALAKGDIEQVSNATSDVLDAFGIDLDPDSAAYRELGLSLLKRLVTALHVIQQRGEGKWTDTPPTPAVISTEAAVSGDTLRSAFVGWQKARNPSPGTLSEYDRAIKLFTELHGIKRSHARQFREALQDVPRQRTGKLRNATLPELSEWGRQHSDAPRLSNGTINKLMGGVQAVAVWARDQGIIPDEVSWSDPFAKMRVEEDEPDREPFSIAELKQLFASPVFTHGERPKGGQGDAAFWLPLLGLFTGARRGELAGLTVADALPDETTGHPVLVLTENKSRNRSLKTPGSARTIPIHQELIRLGFMQFVEDVRRARGENAWLFPEIAPDSKEGLKAWTKWFGRYIRKQGIKDTRKVFHSFRHNFKDALRAARVPEDLNDALTGHSTRGSVGRSYGARDIVVRYGMPTLIDAVSRITYTGLDLSPITRRTRTTPVGSTGTELLDSSGEL
jgi:integrase